MDCTEFQQLLSDYENLTPMQKQQLLEHSQTCEACAEELAQYLLMLQTLKTLPKLTAPDDFLADLNHRIDKENITQLKKPNMLVHLKRYSYRYGAVAACLALVAVIGVNNTELVDKMNGSDDGVIKVVTSTAMPSVKPDFSAKPMASPDVKPTEASKIENTPSVTQAPVTSTKKPNATTTPKSNTNTTSNKNNSGTVQKPLATAIPQPVKATLSPKVTEEPSTVQTFGGYNDVTYGVDNTPPTTSAPTENPNVAVASMIDETEPSAMVLDPNEYELPATTARIANNSDDTDGYSASANSIEVSYAYADKAKEIISAYSISNDGEYYSVSTDKMEEFLQAMSDAGVEYDENCVEMDADTITFRLIIS